jgi:transmembrane sensor
MTAFRDLSPDQRKALEEAAGWRLRLTSDPSLASSAEYLNWCSDPQNAGAREAVDQGWSSVGALDTAPEMLELRRQALARLPRTGARRWGTRRMNVGLLAASVLIGVICAAALYLSLSLPNLSLPGLSLSLPGLYLPTSYKTDIGERRIVALPDGSRISMDSATSVRVSYKKTARSITLDRGRSRFDVAHDPSRPFTVTVGTQTVVAIGTSFDVERLQSTVLITLIQGQVVIKGAEPAATSTAAIGQAEKSISLKAGEQLVVSRNVRPAIVEADLQVARAWEAGRLLFRDERLGDAVARVNRYTPHPIEIDPSIASIRISGVFNAGDIGSFVSAVTSYFPVEASTTGNNTILLQPRT